MLSDDREFIIFVRENIRSVWALELLVLLSRNPSRHWQPSELIRELRANSALIQNNLEIFQRNGLAVSDENGWYFLPANERLKELTRYLAQAFQERPVATMTLVTQADPLQSSSDAFKFRGDKS